MALNFASLTHPSSHSVYHHLLRSRFSEQCRSDSVYPSLPLRSYLSNSPSLRQFNAPGLHTQLSLAMNAIFCPFVDILDDRVYSSAQIVVSLEPADVDVSSLFALWSVSPPCFFVAVNGTKNLRWISSFLPHSTYRQKLTICRPRETFW